mgnify:CR=1 FL=1
MNASTGVDARLSQKEVRKVYNRIARVYDLWGTLTETRARQRGIGARQRGRPERTAHRRAGRDIHRVTRVRQGRAALTCQPPR